jgi:hypothetical protein
MEWDRERELDKCSELLEILENALCQVPSNGHVSKVLARQIFDAFVSTTPPEKEKVLMHLVTIGFDGRGGGKSTKPGNIHLNFGKLVDALCAGTLTAIGIQSPDAAILAAVVLWNSLWRAIKIELSENEAAVLYVMWMLREKSNNTIEKAGLLKKCNSHFTKNQRAHISDSDLQYALGRLQKIKTIGTSENDPNKWSLCEKITVTFR